MYFCVRGVTISSSIRSHFAKFPSFPVNFSPSGISAIIAFHCPSLAGKDEREELHTLIFHLEPVTKTGPFRLTVVFGNVSTAPTMGETRSVCQQDEILRNVYVYDRVKNNLCVFIAITVSKFCLEKTPASCLRAELPQIDVVSIQFLLCYDSVIVKFVF